MGLSKEHGNFYSNICTDLVGICFDKATLLTLPPIVTTGTSLQLIAQTIVNNVKIINVLHINMSTISGLG